MADLTKADFASETWKRVRAHIEQSRAEARGWLETDSDHDTTQKIRGRIATYNELLGLEKAPAQVPRTGFDPYADQQAPD